MEDLINVLDKLPENKIEELTTITQRIIETGKVETVILFGSYARGTYRERDGKIRGRKSDYDILVITRNTKLIRELKDILSEKFEDLDTLVNLEIHSIKFVNSNLEDAHYFFTDIKREGKTLYDSGRFELSEPSEINPTQRREIAEKDFEKWFDDAKEFLKLSTSSRRRKKMGLAAFNMQQCCEMCYSSVEMVFKHYRTKEHKLAVLRRKMKRLDRRIDEAFPLETKEQKLLFEHLDFAYIGGRYLSEEEYSVNREQLNYWSKEAKKLMKLTEIICKEHIEALKNIEKKWQEKNE